MPSPTGDTRPRYHCTPALHWTQLPVAILQDATDEVWSGSVVDDTANTSRLGARGASPLVAICTSEVRATGVQRQSFAYSNDGGTTWTKYAGTRCPRVSRCQERREMTLSVTGYIPCAGRRGVVVVTLSCDSGRVGWSPATRDITVAGVSTWSEPARVRELQSIGLPAGSDPDRRPASTRVDAARICG